MWPDKATIAVEARSGLIYKSPEVVSLFKGRAAVTEGSPEVSLTVSPLTCRERGLPLQLCTVTG